MQVFAPADFSANYAKAGAAKATAPAGKLFLLAILAGLLIGFPAAVTNMACFALENPSVIRVISGLLFAFGLGMVVMTGAELLTGNTLIFMSVLDGKARLSGMLRNWAIVLVGNFIGALLLAFVCARFGWLNAGQEKLAQYAMQVAQGKMTMPFANALMMGVLCNILVTVGVLLEPGGAGWRQPDPRCVGAGDVLRRLRVQPLHCGYDVLYAGPVCKASICRSGGGFPAPDLGPVPGR